MNRRRAYILLGLVCSLAVSTGCSDFGYYWQCLQGQMDVINRSQPVASLLEKPDTSPDLRRRLALSREIRDYASNVLLLPDNQSYRRYADLERDYALWNVVATPEFSLEPTTWCFPIAGCVSYRGFFTEEKADEFAHTLRESGQDVFRYGVSAYSTLSWFNDPILNTFWRRSATSLAGLMFHELAHQVVYLPGETDFNEAFATAVEIAGTIRWLESRNDEDGLEKLHRQYDLEGDFQQQAKICRDTLARLYAADLTAEEKRLEKQRIIGDFQNLLRELGKGYGDERMFESWLGPDLNNARFALLSTYREMVPAFLNLLAVKQNDLAAFYAEVERLGSLSREDRRAALNHLQSLNLYASLWTKRRG